MRYKKLLTFYIDVGQLPVEKADAFVEKVKQDSKDVLENLPTDVGVLWIPVRPNGGTRIEICDLAPPSLLH